MMAMPGNTRKNRLFRKIPKLAPEAEGRLTVRYNIKTSKTETTLCRNVQSNTTASTISTRVSPA